MNGCSLLFMDRVPDNHLRLQSFDCTSSYAAPVLDTVWGAANLLGGVVAASANDATWSSSTPRSTTMAVGFGWAALMTVSAIAGYSKASDCGAARTAMYARQEASRSVNVAASVAPPPLTVVPTAALPAALIGCLKDTDCKGDRICSKQECVSPSTPAR